MPKTSLTPIAAPGAYATAPTEIAWTAADVGNKNQFALTGKELILAFNSGVADPHTITITSMPNEYGRSGTIASFSITTGKYYMFGPVLLPGWVQTDGKLYLEADHAEIKFAIIRLP